MLSFCAPTPSPNPINSQFLVFLPPPYPTDPYHTLIRTSLLLAHLNSNEFTCITTGMSSPSIHVISHLLKPPHLHLTKLQSSMPAHLMFHPLYNSLSNIPNVYYHTRLPVSFPGTGCLGKVLLCIFLCLRRPLTCQQDCEILERRDQPPASVPLAPNLPLFSHMYFIIHLKLLIN